MPIGPATLKPVVRDLGVLFLHLPVTVARLAGPGGARSVVTVPQRQFVEAAGYYLGTLAKKTTYSTAQEKCVMTDDVSARLAVLERRWRLLVGMDKVCYALRS